MAAVAAGSGSSGNHAHMANVVGSALQHSGSMAFNVFFEALGIPSVASRAARNWIGVTPSS